MALLVEQGNVEDQADKVKLAVQVHEDLMGRQDQLDKLGREAAEERQERLVGQENLVDKANKENVAHKVRYTPGRSTMLESWGRGG